MVLKSYNVFVEGRQILETVLITNKAIDSGSRSHREGVVY